MEITYESVLTARIQWKLHLKVKGWNLLVRIVYFLLEKNVNYGKGRQNHGKSVAPVPYLTIPCWNPHGRVKQEQICDKDLWKVTYFVWNAQKNHENGEFWRGRSIHANSMINIPCIFTLLWILLLFCLFLMHIDVTSREMCTYMYFLSISYSIFNTIIFYTIHES